MVIKNIDNKEYFLTFYSSSSISLQIKIIPYKVKNEVIKDINQRKNDYNSSTLFLKFQILLLFDFLKVQRLSKNFQG
jgi:hypothetical protein